MTNVDFYLVKEAKIEDCYAFVCKLVDKVFQQRHQLYINTNSKEECNILDDLLWTFRDDAFIPHNIYGSSKSNIQLGFNLDPTEHKNILLNLTPVSPPFHDRFQRILEIVPQNMKENSRQKFRVYREKNYEIATHDLTKS